MRKSLLLVGLVCLALAPAASEHGAAFSTVTLAVPAGNNASPFDTPRSVTVPSGWSGSVWARVSGARFLLWAPNGNLLVSATNAGQVVELVRGTGVPHQKVIASGLSLPQGLAFDTIDGSRVLYVAESNEVDRYPWNADGTLGARTVVIPSLPDTNAAGDDVHRLKGIAVGSDHTIYVNIGSADNATPRGGDSPPRATIVAYRPSGSLKRVFARGVRNGEGLAFAPDGSLWTAVNNRDQIAYPFHHPYAGLADAYGQVMTAYVNDHPPEELARLTAGRNLGWPYCNPDPDTKAGGLTYANLPFDNDQQNNPTGTALNCSKLTPLERGLPAHSAPLGLTFLEGSSLKGKWSQGAVVAAHGSWDRTPPRPPAVLWLPWSGKTHTLGRQVTLVGGFQDALGNRWGRPTDAVAGPDGDLYVADDQAGAVYRLGPS